MRTTDAHYSPAHADVVINVTLTGLQLDRLKAAFKASVHEWPTAHEITLHDLLSDAQLAVSQARQAAYRSR